MWLRFRFSGTPQRHRLSWACILCPRFVPFLGLNSSGDQVLGKHTFPRCGVSYHLPGSSRLFSWCAAASQVCLVSLLGCWSLAVALLMDPRKTWLVTESLLAVWLGMPSLRPSLPLSFWLWLAPACLPASGGGWAGPQLASSPLVFSQSFVLWAVLAVP